MKEIPVSKRNLIIAVILAVVVALGILVIENWPLHTEQGSAAATNEDRLVSTAAVNAIEQVFQVNYQEGKEAWLERICEVSTPAGCELFSAGADRMWEKYVDAKSVVTAASQAAEKVADNGFEQVWKMTITLSSPLPGSNKTQDTAYVVLAKTESGWKFDRFLMEEEINAILARGKTPTTTVEEGKK
ncbi:hypothetical protein BECAL_03030 [Bellilinea caldifistulae]|uniref:Uncharacterized protein n=1 Tax=Bellilinea caldifistulae TaxID=360411 RepID=A0A0P6X5D4_9CHLR|nr:hypothetical protein [Bellilinea caldifistulae]KPL74613.1 hypothetical protein AC812_12550 [Bellilinea caldifistulae]GAP11836.1 hypothetical protein BECAL_03030 [Bellilinea caldifistulae]